MKNLNNIPVSSESPFLKKSSSISNTNEELQKHKPEEISQVRKETQERKTDLKQEINIKYF